MFLFCRFVVCVSLSQKSPFRERSIKYVLYCNSLRRLPEYNINSVSCFSFSGSLRSLWKIGGVGGGGGLCALAAFS